MSSLLGHQYLLVQCKCGYVDHAYIFEDNKACPECGETVNHYFHSSLEPSYFNHKNNSSKQEQKKRNIVSSWENLNPPPPSSAFTTV